nr:MAG: hypothetical protein 2 [Leviviridae sp.]
MFGDTITVTINAVAKVLSKINQDGYSSEYLLRADTEEFRMRIRNTTYADKTRGGKKVDRHNVELVHRVYAVAPATVDTIRKAYSIIENDQGDPSTAVVKFGAGMFAFHTEANITKLFNFES